MSVVQQKWNCVAVKMPIKFVFDYALYVDGKMMAVAECRCRNHEFGAFDTIICSLHKLHAARNFTQDGVKAVFIVGFSDGSVYWHDFRVQEEGYYRITQGGRTDRNDWQDIEPVIHINLDDFKKL